MALLVLRPGTQPIRQHLPSLYRLESTYLLRLGQKPGGVGVTLLGVNLRVLRHQNHPIGQPHDHPFQGEGSTP